MTVSTKYSNKSAQLVEEIRNRFLEDYENNKDLYDESDINRIRTNDWYVKRFLLSRRRDADQAFEMLRNTMRWRKEMGLPTMRDIDFPLEFYKVGGLFPYEKDKDGNVVIFLRIRMHRKIPELAEPVKKFLMYIVNKVDVEVDGNGTAIVFDCSGAGYSNMDLDFLTFLITSGNNYFPVGLKYILVYELSWVLNAFRKIAMSLIPQSFLPLIKFANKNDITNYIPLENLPDYMGGNCKRNYRYIPNNCTSVEKLAIEYGHTQQDIDRILPIFEPLLEEADEAIAQNSYIDPPLVVNEDENVKQLETDKLSIIRTKPWDQLLGIFPNDVIQFNFDPYINAYQSSVILKNLTKSQLAFKVQSNSPNNYNVTPRLGILLENASLKFDIQLMSEQTYRTKDKFMILALPIGDTKMNANDFGRLWKENKSDIVSYKLSSSISSVGYKSSIITDKESDDINKQISRLTDRCNQLESSQTRLSLLLNFMLIVIVLLSCLIIYSHSSSQIFSLKTQTLPNFKPKFP